VHTILEGVAIIQHRLGILLFSTSHEVNVGELFGAIGYYLQLLVILVRLILVHVPTNNIVIMLRVGRRLDLQISRRRLDLVVSRRRLDLYGSRRRLDVHLAGEG
jgi:hypothetical protein